MNTLTYTEFLKFKIHTLYTCGVRTVIYVRTAHHVGRPAFYCSCATSSEPCPGHERAAASRGTEHLMLALLEDDLVLARLRRRHMQCSDREGWCLLCLSTAASCHGGKSASSWRADAQTQVSRAVSIALELKAAKWTGPRHVCCLLMGVLLALSRTALKCSMQLLGGIGMTQEVRGGLVAMEPEYFQRAGVASDFITWFSSCISSAGQKIFGWTWCDACEVP